MMNDSADLTDQRLIALEMRIAHYERTLEEMSDVMTRQGQDMDRLSRLVQRLRDRVMELEGGWNSSPQDDRPPPHY